MRIRWNKPTESGLGDRLMDMRLVVTYARLNSAQLLLVWPKFEAKSIDAEHRRTDILVGNVLKYLTFPKEVAFDSSPADEIFPNYLGGGVDNHDFWHAYLQGSCSFETFITTLDQVTSEFGFCEAVNSFTSSLPATFVSFHVRRSDKVRNEGWPTDNHMVKAAELPELDALTIRAIDRHLSEGCQHMFFCGDEDAKTQLFIEHASSKGANIIRLPEMQKWETTFYDMAVMTKSSANVVSNRRSSFCLFPSLVGRRPCYTVYDKFYEKSVG